MSAENSGKPMGVQRSPRPSSWGGEGVAAPPHSRSLVSIFWPFRLALPPANEKSWTALELTGGPVSRVEPTAYNATVDDVVCGVCRSDAGEPAGSCGGDEQSTDERRTTSRQHRGQPAQPAGQCFTIHRRTVPLPHAGISAGISSK